MLFTAKGNTYIFLLTYLFGPRTPRRQVRADRRIIYRRENGSDVLVNQRIPLVDCSAAFFFTRVCANLPQSVYYVISWEFARFGWDLCLVLLGWGCNTDF